MHKLRIYIIATAIFLCGGYACAFVQINIGPQEAQIESSIKYSVIGRYRAEFDQYQGSVIFDKEMNEIQGVYLNISAASIRSNCSWCDKIVRSKQLLHVDKYPEVVFESKKINKEAGGYAVTGLLSLHGKTKELSFPFKVTRIKDDQKAEEQLFAQGQWIINRKEFDIIWNKLLDKGGIFVGNTITVDWEINLSITN